jgi:hypothetical protein
MSTEPHELALLSQAQPLLAQVQTVDECREIRDKAEALRNYGRKRDRCRELFLLAAEVKLHAERRMGQILAGRQLTPVK